MRIVFATLGSLGDLHPVLALAREAQARGHEVVVAASPNYEANVTRADIAFHPLRPAIPQDPKHLEYYFDLKRGPERLLRGVVFEHVRDTHADMESATRGADLLVVGELLYTAPMVAEKIGIPWMNIVLAPTSMLSVTDPCVLAPAPFLFPLRHLGTWVHRLAYIAGRLQGSLWATEFYRFRRERDLPAGPNPIFEGKHSPHGTLVMFPQFFAHPQKDWHGDPFQTGFPFFEQPSAAGDDIVDRFLADGEPPIVFTLGSIVAHFEPRFYSAAAGAAQSVGRRAILLAGRNASCPNDVPPSVLVVDYARLSRVLPHAAAVVHAGGIGTCAEALRAGIPSVVIPFSFDQPDNAYRMRRLGVAEILSRRAITIPNLANKLRQVLGGASYHKKATALSALIDPALAVRRAMERMEQVWANHQSVSGA